MKKTILQTTAIMLIMAGMISSCGKEKEDIQFYEYFLPNGCYWLTPSNDVTIIRNTQEFEQWTTCDFDATVPNIDFEKYTLINAHGGSEGYAISSISKQIVKISDNQFILKVTVYLKQLTQIDSWFVTLLMPKLRDNVDFKLDIKLKLHK
jgi:hypothetical protein